MKDIEFQDSIHVQSTESDLPSRTPKRTSVEAESEDNIKISPLIFNHPWISTTRGSSSKNLKVNINEISCTCLLFILIFFMF